MCGRFKLFAGDAVIHDRFGTDPTGPTRPRLTPRYNVAPTQTVAVVGLKPDGQRRGLALLKWGLVPHFANSPKPGPTNARAETVDRLPTFRQAYGSADGFYEWKTKGKRKLPHRFTLADGGLMAVRPTNPLVNSPRNDGPELLTA